MPAEDRKKPGMTITTRSRNSSESSGISMKSPRTPRFAEATAVNSPIEPSKAGRSPFDDPVDIKTTHYAPQPQPSDVGFGYIANSTASRHASMVPVEEDARRGPASPALKSPLKSALKSPGAAPRKIDNPLSPTFKENPLSPTWKEEERVEKMEKVSEKDNAQDIKVKTRVRIAKMLLRGVNFSCSLIILSMLSATFTIFNTTRHLPPRNNLPAWAPSTKTWPQITLLCMACLSLAICIGVFWGYWKGGHRRAEKAAVYYTVFAVGFFIFSIIMWGVAAGILIGSKQGSNGQDIWGWSCKDNKRQQLFQDKVSYGVVCRMQNWSLICVIIEVVVETITILIYAVVFYRYYSKNRLRKTMDLRDRARSDLYLAQLRTQTAPNTPGFAPPAAYAMSPGFGGPASPRFQNGFAQDHYSKAEEGGFFPGPASPTTAKPFALQPPPIKVQQPTPTSPSPATFPSAPGEKQYAAVPIPGAYQPTSPAYNPAPMTIPTPGQAMTTNGRVSSPEPAARR